MKKPEPIIETPDGILIIDGASTAANADWIRAGRLKERADAGDEEAQRELEELENTPLYEF
jgi:hypothetical protein